MTKKRSIARENFVRLATARTAKAMKAIQLIGNLANTSIYEYSEKDVEKVFAALQAATKEAKSKFGSVQVAKTSLFTLE